ncbi:MAG TPA: GYF domain-containing protein, partial [Anaeromyxobacteraceae bacterium]|nr:GYF domain-containing protein [Anaeromyxobacteraceae bacterium]
MKFTCDSCGAQYMISDDKVGPNGVKVRCKKCQHVVLVRRAAEPAAPAPSAPATEGGLDAELGQAFDSMLGGPPAPAEPPAPAPDLQSTQIMSEEDAAKIASARAPASPSGAAASDWYVAIGEAQVGPLPLAEVKRKWETGEVGPDSLVWKPGMGDWEPLSAVSDLAAALAPVPRAQKARPEPAREPAPARAAAPAAPPEEPSWKPTGASALAALASEEMSARAPEARPAPARPAGGGARSLVEQMNLPDAGGVDPTGAIPLTIKGLEPTPEASRRRTAVARGAAQVRHRRSAVRWFATFAVLVLVAGGGAAAWAFRERLLGALRGT